MKNFLLFLDESKPNGHNIEHLCLGGVIIEEENYRKKIIPEVNMLKTNVFGSNDVILHEMEIRKSKSGHFLTLRSPQKRLEFWNSMENVFSNNNFLTLGAAINIKEYCSVYNKTSNNDPYFIVLQIVLENFVHFLEENNYKGSVYIESQNPTDDCMLRNHYHRIIANGTLYLNKNVYQHRLMNINFLIKGDNNIGLQLADFVPGTLNRKCNSLPIKNPSLLTTIDNLLYDGGKNLKKRFGFKQLP